MVQETHLTRFDGQWVLLVVVCGEGEANLVVTLVSELGLGVATGVEANLERLERS